VPALRSQIVSRHGQVTREDLLRVAEELCWTHIPNPKGYDKLHCSCGAHKTWIHETPSDPNYYRNRISYLRRTCRCAPETAK
jgi:hypothetical protein